MDHAKILWTDKLLAQTILRVFPYSVRPNHVTAFRLLATPFVLWVLAAENYIWGIPIFLLVASTDAIDGAMARTRDQITDFGKLFDPLADKLLIGSVVILVIWRYLGAPLAIVMVTMEFLFLAGGIYEYKVHAKVVHANWWGKIKMILQVVGVAILLVGLLTNVTHLFSIATMTFYLAILFAVVSLVTHGL